MSALGGAHTDRRVAFYQLHIAVTQPGRVHDVFDLQVFVEIDEFPAFWVWEDGPGVIHLRGASNGLIFVGGHINVTKRGARRVAAIGQYHVERVSAVYTAS